MMGNNISITPIPKRYDIDCTNFALQSGKKCRVAGGSDLMLPVLCYLSWAQPKPTTHTRIFPYAARQELRGMPTELSLDFHDAD